MSAINWSVSVDDRATILHLEELPSRLRSKLHPVIARLTEQLLARVRAAEPVRTGALRRATQAFVDDKENAVRGRVRIVGTQSQLHAAAAALEYGAHRLVRVRQHQTHIDSVFGRATAKQLVIVDAYTRRANITAQRFLRGPAANLRATALAELERVVDDEVRR